MQELEKILEEIEQRVNYYKEHATLEYVDICAGLREAEGIICKHMNDGWIPASKPPETGGRCLVKMKHHAWISDYESKTIPESEKVYHAEYTGGSCCWPIDQCGECPNNQGKEI